MCVTVKKAAHPGSRVVYARPSRGIEGDILLMMPGDGSAYNLTFGRGYRLADPLVAGLSSTNNSQNRARTTKLKHFRRALCLPVLWASMPDRSRAVMWAV